MKGPDGVDVCWLELCADDVPARNEWLSAAEKATGAAMRIPKRRDDWRLGRWAAKCAVAVYMQPKAVALSQIEIEPAASGAPVALVANTRAPLVISLSHRDGRAMCAVASPDVQLGCDLEVIEPRSSAFAADYFTVAEQALVLSLRSEHRNAALTLIWSLKECALKALQVGLRADTRDIEVSFPDVVGFEDAIAERSVQPGGWNAAVCRTATSETYWALWQRDGKLLRTFAASRPFHLVPLSAGLISALHVDGVTGVTSNGCATSH